MKEHIHRVRKINFLAKKAHFQTFDFQPHQILVLDTHHLRLLEQVHPGLDFHQITNFRSTLRKGTLFGKLFLRRLNEKGITIGELRTILFDCAHEIQDFCATLMEKHTISFDEGLDFDNVVVVDFNPKTRKPTLAFVDHGGSHQTIGKR
jgi:hypothetical protein